MAYIVLIQLLLFAAGASAVTIGLLVFRRPMGWYWYAATKVGIVLTSLILVSALQSEESRDIPLDPVTIGYMIGLAFVGVGLVGVARDVARKVGEETASGSLMHRREEP